MNRNMQITVNDPIQFIPGAVHMASGRMKRFLNGFAAFGDVFPLVNLFFLGEKPVLLNQPKDAALYPRP